MPTYSYMCTKCEYQFTSLQKIVDREYPLTQPCPHCQTIGTVEKVIDAPKPISPLRVDGLIRPSSDFRERITEIKKNIPDSYAKNIKDY